MVTSLQAKGDSESKGAWIGMRNKTPVGMFLAGAAAWLLMESGCSFGPAQRLADTAIGVVEAQGFQDASERWEISSNRYWHAKVSDEGIEVANTRLGSGVSPIWHLGKAPKNFEIAVQAKIEKEGLDGGWGVEFGAKERKYAYRVLVYASGRFCVDRFFGLYPEFIHCIPLQPEVRAGEETNILSVKVVGERITIRVNEQTIVEFTDDRYEPGDIALAVAGSGTRVMFRDFMLISLD